MEEQDRDEELRTQTKTRTRVVFRLCSTKWSIPRIQIIFLIGLMLKPSGEKRYGRYPCVSMLRIVCVQNTN